MKTLAEGHVHDLKDAVLSSHTTRIVAGEFSDCSSADVIVITAGVSQIQSMRSRRDDLHESAAIIRDIITEVRRYNSDGIVVIASNPVDALTYAALKWSGSPSARVIGSGTSLDTSRLRWRLGERYGISPHNVHAYVIGEHGDSQVAALSSAHIAGIPLEEFCRDQELPYDEADLKTVADETRTAGYTIRAEKGATYYGIGAALVRIVTAILRDERAVFTVSTLVPPPMGLGDVCLSLPAIIGSGGVERILSIPLNEAERRALKRSAEIVRQDLGTLDFGAATLR
jgi:L-lactate dehydrogenase